VNVFDEAVLLAGGMVRWYRRTLPVTMPVKLLGSCPQIVLSPRRIIKWKNNFYDVKMPGKTIFIDISLLTYYLEIMCRQA
jgi:hypothetical protein